MLRTFYFSGTGNARNAARWMVETWRARGQAGETIDLARTGAERIAVQAGDDVGLASPTHGFNFPPITLAFLLAFPPAPSRNRVCIINTRGGVRLLGLYLPGLSGAAQLLAALVFVLKCYRVVGILRISYTRETTPRALQRSNAREGPETRDSRERPAHDPPTPRGVLVDRGPGRCRGRAAVAW